MKPYKELIGINDYKGTYGAAIGDIYGSYYEFKHGPKTPKQYIRIHDSSTYTDDTVLTVAVADYLQHKQEGCPVSSYLRKWARKYASAGYGAKFSSWIYEESPKPYHSCGNGSAMRVSAVAYIAQSIQEVEKLAVEVTEVTHNHPEGIKGAEAIAVAVYLARTGASKEEIKEAKLSYYPKSKP